MFGGNDGDEPKRIIRATKPTKKSTKAPEPKDAVFVMNVRSTPGGALRISDVLQQVDQFSLTDQQRDSLRRELQNQLRDGEFLYPTMEEVLPIDEQARPHPGLLSTRSLPQAPRVEPDASVQLYVWAGLIISIVLFAFLRLWAFRPRPTPKEEPQQKKGKRQPKKRR